MDVKDPNTDVRVIHIESGNASRNGDDSRPYHHGDLPTALVGATLDLIASEGLQAFSVTAVARRVGVSNAAPYRHFPSRDHLLAAVARRGYEEVATAFAAAFEAAGPKPADRLAACAGAYVRFAAEQPAMFEVLFGAGLDKAEHPELRQASDALITAVWPVVVPLTPDGSDEQVWALIQAVVGLAHGYSALLIDGALQHFTPDGAACEPSPTEAPISDAQIEAAETQAVAATRALLRGRSLLFS